MAVSLLGIIALPWRRRGIRRNCCNQVLRHAQEEDGSACGPVPPDSAAARWSALKRAADATLSSLRMERLVTASLAIL